MKNVPLLLVLMSVWLLSVEALAQNRYTVIANDSTFQLLTEQRKQTNGENTELTPEMDTSSFARMIFGIVYNRYGREASLQVNHEIAVKEINRTRKLYNNDLDSNYVNTTDRLFYSRFAGFWRLKVDTLVARVELTKNNNGRLRIKPERPQDELIFPNLNSRVLVYHENVIELGSLLGESIELYNELLYELEDQDESKDNEADENLQEPFRYIGTHPVLGRVVFKKLKDTIIE